MALKDKLITLEDLKAVHDVDALEITGIKADLSEQVGLISKVKDNWINTSTTPVDLTPISSSIGRMYSIVDCSPGDKFVINAYSDSNTARAWCFIDSEYNAIDMADVQVVVEDLELVAPANATKLIINDMRGGLCYKVGNNLASEVRTIKETSSGLSDVVKSALLECFNHMVWSNGSASDYKNSLRRALYGWDEDTLYKLMNTPVSMDGGTTINTGVAIWETDYSFTLFAEYIDYTNHFVDTENKMLFRQVRNKPWGALYLQTYKGGNSGSNYNVTTVLDFVSGSGDSVRRVWKHLESRTVNPHTLRRLVVTYSAESNSVTMDFSVDGQIVTPNSTTGDVDNFDFYEMAGDNPMLIGSLEEKTRFFNGVINDFRIIKKAATSSEIAEYLSGGNNT